MVRRSGIINGASLMRSVKPLLLPVLIVTLWSTGVSLWTGGFSSFTSYSIALREAGPTPREMPNFALIDHNGHRLTLRDLRGRYLLVDFMYLQCRSVCGTLRSRLLEYRDEFKNDLADRMLFLSVSFDAERDTPEILKGVWEGTEAGSGWIYATFEPARREEMMRELKRSGVIVYRKESGDFNHTAVHFLIDPSGRVVRIIRPSNGIKKNIEEIRQSIL
jgi:protein SCO1/2